MTINKKIKTIADHFGLMDQITKLREEMHELEDAVIAYKNAIQLEASPIDTATERLHVIEEMCDVRIVLDQLSYLLHSAGDEKTMREHKLERTIERIGTGYYE